jgi:putative sigma-54 modulation protein
MRLELTGRHLDITGALRRVVTAKLAKLERLMSDSAHSAQVVLSQEKQRSRADITLHARGDVFLHAFGTSTNWENAVSQAVDKLAQQAQKVKGKWQERKRQGSRARLDEAQPAERSAPKARAARPRPLSGLPRPSRDAIRSMSLAAAVREVESTAEGVVVFLDPERGAVSVVYRRRNGEISLVET